jgi:sugar transferase EpsL
LKRLLDVVVASALLLLLSLLIAIVAVTVRLSLGRPVLLRQRRPGLGGVPFELLKFRTMSNTRNDQGTLLPDDQRLHRAGRFLRQMSLDELPEFINVIKGDMSLVGPRPLLLQYLERYTPQQARRHEVKPGITGWAQIHGRNALTWDEKFRLDVWYVDQRSFWLDLRILARTTVLLVTREGISQPGHATAREFMGPANQ